MNLGAIGSCCLAACLAVGCKVDDKARGPASSATSPATPAIASAEAPPVPARPAARESWNDERIAWRPFEAGLQEAKQSGKPVMLVVYTSWCPHCRNYSKVFSDDRVVQAAKKLVMIRVNQDESREEAARFAPDGQYIPRTLFLTASGDIMADLRARGDKYRYFYPEDDPLPVLGSMNRAAK